MREHARLQTAVLLRRFAFQLNRTTKAGDADSIHDLRVSIRRLSRCLREFSQFYTGKSWKKLRRRLSELMDLAGAVRDVDIALKMLDEAGISRRAAIVTRLEAERVKASRDLEREAQRWKSRSFSRRWRAELGL